MTETEQKIIAEAFFFKRTMDDNICFHVGDTHIAILTQEEAKILRYAMERDGSWHQAEFGTEEEMQS